MFVDSLRMAVTKSEEAIKDKKLQKAVCTCVYAFVCVFVCVCEGENMFISKSEFVCVLCVLRMLRLLCVCLFVYVCEFMCCVVYGVCACVCEKLNLISIYVSCL